jgi:hypothetical protein
VIDFETFRHHPLVASGTVRGHPAQEKINPPSPVVNGLFTLTLKKSGVLRFWLKDQ